MADQGGARKDASPRRASKKSDRTTSVDRASRGKEIVVAAPRDPEPIPSTSQQTPMSSAAQATNEKLDRLTTLLGGFIEKCSSEKVQVTPDFSGFS